METGRRRRAVITLGVLTAVLSPALTGRDSFPLSTFPMYAHDRDDTASFRTAVGVTSSGTTEWLSLELIADTDDPLVAQGALRDAVQRGDGDELCREIADRVAADDRRDLDLIEVVELTLDLETGDQLDRRVHGRCEVP